MARVTGELPVSLTMTLTILKIMPILFRIFPTDPVYKVPLSLYPQLASEEVMERVLGQGSRGVTTGRGQVGSI